MTSPAGAPDVVKVDRSPTTALVAVLPLEDDGRSSTTVALRARPLADAPWSMTAVTPGIDRMACSARSIAELSAAVSRPLVLAATTYVAASTRGRLTAADSSAIDRAEQAMRSIPGVTAVIDQGASANGRARRATVVLDLPSSSSGKTATSAVGGLRSTFTTSGAPAGLVMHLSGGVAEAVDQQNQNGHTQTLTELLSILFIVALLFLTFRSLLAPLVALLPSAVALIAAGPVIAQSTHIGVQVSDLTPILLT